MTPKQYEALNKKASPPSKMWRNCAVAFLIGGLICTIGQGILLLAQRAGLDRKTAGGLASVCLILLTALLTGIGCFDNIAKHAGAGTLVPITGFANAIAAPAVEFKTEGMILGTAAKMFTIAGPVIVYGVSASVVYGLIYWLVQKISGGF